MTIMLDPSIRAVVSFSARVRLQEQTGLVVRWPNWCSNWSVMPFFIVLSSILYRSAPQNHWLVFSFKSTHIHIYIYTYIYTHIYIYTSIHTLTQSQSLIGIDIIWSKKVWEKADSPTERDHFCAQTSCNFCGINCSFSAHLLRGNTFLIYFFI